MIESNYYNAVEDLKDFLNNETIELIKKQKVEIFLQAIETGKLI